MKKLLIALFAAAAFTVSAQTARSGSWAIEFPKEGKAVNVSQTFTPFFKIDNEDRGAVDLRTNERDMNSAKHWLAIDVAFSTNKPKSAAQWPKWLDNVEVEIDVFLPTNDDRGNIIWTVIGGKQTLASLSADDKRHFVRMMIPPQTIYRYFVFDGSSGDPAKDYGKITSDLKKYASDLPVMVSISYGGRTVYGFQTCGKDIFNRLDKNQSNQRAKLFYTLLKGDSEGGYPTAASTVKLFDYIAKNKFNPQTFKYMPDELLPVSKTPFAWVLFDRFEAVKETSGK